MYNRYLASAASSPTIQPTAAPNIPNSPPNAPPNAPSTFPQNGEEGDGGSSVPVMAETRDAPPGSSQNLSVFSDLSRLLSSRLHGVKLDRDTILVLLVVWFLLADGDELDWDLMLTVGALLIFGV